MSFAEKWKEAENTLPVFEHQEQKPVMDKGTLKTTTSASTALPQALLNEVGARIEHRAEGIALVFDPPLEREEVDTDRWDKASELEEMFWEAYERGMI